MSWQDIIKENFNPPRPKPVKYNVTSGFSPSYAASQLIELLEGLKDKIRSIEEELPRDILYVVEQIQESKFGDIEDIKRANRDLNVARGDIFRNDLDAEGEIKTLIGILRRYE